MQDNAEYDFRTPDWIKYVLIALVILWLGLLLSSCTTQKKATSYFDNHAFQGAAYCESRFPVDSFFKPGETKTKLDTQFIPGPEIKIPCPTDSTKKDSVTAKCPPAKIITITKETVDTAGMVDRAKYVSLQGQIIDLESQLQSKENTIGNQKAKIDRLTSGRNTWRWLGIIFMAIVATGLGTFVFVKFKR